MRGIVGQSITPKIIDKYVTAFGKLLLQENTKSGEENRKHIILGRDSRVSGKWINPLSYSLLLALGFDVVDIDIVPTPTVPNDTTLNAYVILHSHCIILHHITSPTSPIVGAIHGTAASCVRWLDCHKFS